MVLGNSSYICCPEIWAMSLELWCPEGGKNLWRFFAIYGRFQNLKSLWLFFPCLLVRVCPAFCLGEEESCWLCDLFGKVCEEYMPMYTSLLGPQEASSPKKHSKALTFALIFKYYWGGESEQQGSPCPPGSGVLGLVLPGSCVLGKELPLSLHRLKPVTITVRFLLYPRAWRPVLPLPPCQTSHLP